MKRVITFIVLLLVAFTAVSAGNENFDPKRFQADMEAFIVKYAELTPKQTEKFLPLFREMQSKQRVLFDEKRQYHHTDLTDEAACERAIQRMDNIDVQIRKIQKTYHQKFLTVLPATKVMKLIKGEDIFHKRAFRNAAKCGRKPRR